MATAIAQDHKLLGRNGRQLTRNGNPLWRGLKPAQEPDSPDQPASLEDLESQVLLRLLGAKSTSVDGMTQTGYSVSEYLDLLKYLKEQDQTRGGNRCQNLRALYCRYCPR